MVSTMTKIFGLHISTFRASNRPRNCISTVNTQLISTHSHQTQTRQKGRFDLTLGVFKLQGFTRCLESAGFFSLIFVFFDVMNVAKNTRVWHGETRFGASLPMSTMH